ncbi:hypothetical protein [Anaerococcus provencensis]|uniref:hypothetical protein n=1 Tax=Anaerococcus provencensis TaxID=938293 RepID=UPI001E35B54E|nr:hypothetical protein [Anaerococcus provencensis]
MDEVEERLEELNNLTISADFYQDQDLVKDTFAQIKSLEEEKENLDETWFELNLSLEG